MNRERLEHLIQTLEGVIERDKGQNHSHFYMRRWGLRRTPDDECGTRACAWGHEALTPEAQGHGVVVTWHPRPGLDGGYEMTIRYAGTENGVRSAGKYFGLDTDTAARLFDFGYYSQHPEPQDVIANIRHLMRVGETDFSRLPMALTDGYTNERNRLNPARGDFT